MTNKQIFSPRRSDYMLGSTVHFCDWCGRRVEMLWTDDPFASPMRHIYTGEVTCPSMPQA